MVALRHNPKRHPLRYWALPSGETGWAAILTFWEKRSPSITPQQTATEMNRLTFAIRAEYPKEFRKTGFRTDLTIAATPLQEHLTGQVRPALLILTAMRHDFDSLGDVSLYRL
jgi:hypothetical protein